MNKQIRTIAGRLGFEVKADSKQNALQSLSALENAKGDGIIVGFFVIDRHMISNETVMRHQALLLNRAYAKGLFTHLVVGEGNDSLILIISKHRTLKQLNEVVSRVSEEEEKEYEGEGEEPVELDLPGPR